MMRNHTGKVELILTADVKYQPVTILLEKDKILYIMWTVNIVFVIAINQQASNIAI